METGGLVVIPDCLALKINLNLIESKNMISSRLILNLDQKQISLFIT